MLQCCPSCKETGVESRLRFHYLALDKGVWLCPREDCTFPLGHEELDSLLVNVSSKSSGGALSSFAAPDTDVVSLCPPNVHKLKTTAGTSLPSAVESSSSSSYSQLTGSSSHGNSDYSRSHGSSGYANPSNSGYNSHTNSASGQSHTGSYGNTTTQAATAHQDGCPPRPLDVSDSSEMDADKDIAELLGMLSPEQPTSLQW